MQLWRTLLNLRSFTLVCLLVVVVSYEQGDDGFWCAPLVGSFAVCTVSGCDVDLPPVETNVVMQMRHGILWCQYIQWSCASFWVVCSLYVQIHSVFPELVRLEPSMYTLFVALPIHDELRWLHSWNSLLHFSLTQTPLVDDVFCVQCCWWWMSDGCNDLIYWCMHFASLNFLLLLGHLSVVPKVQRRENVRVLPLELQ